MPAISAEITSRLARDIYAISDFPNLSMAEKVLNEQYKGAFEFAKSSALYAKTGPIGIKISSAFGFVLYGKGAFDGHAVIIFRGSVSAADWLSNVNALTTITSAGYSVHKGFKDAFDSMKPEISVFLNDVSRKGEKKIHSVHCIGHSLGGALATVCASWIKNKQQNKSTYLYSFGSPRTGLDAFAKDLTNKMGNNHIFRVHHKTDPVPLLPTWPYVHAPTNDSDYLLYSPGVFIHPIYHTSGEYCETIKSNSWGQLQGLRNKPKDAFSLTQWLKSKIKAIFSMDNIMNLNDSLVYILKLCGYVVPASINGFFALVDTIAYTLKKGLQILATAGSLIVLFIKKLSEILGVVLEVEAKFLTVEYIRELFTRLHNKIVIEAEKALRLGLA